jgi:hypothetical protein
MQRLQWDAVERIVATGTFHLLQRDHGTLARYQQFVQEITQEYHSIEVYIAHTVFGARVERMGARLALDPEGEGEWRGAKRVIFRANDFPYHLEENIVHELLWSNAALSADEVREHVARHMQERARRTFVYFENPAHLKTIPGIFHIHVFSVKD